jgi:hypothetical protein
VENTQNSNDTDTAESKPMACALRKWKADERLKPDLTILLASAANLDLAIGPHGFFCRQSGKRIHENHLNCLLKTSYRNEGGSLRGRALDKLLGHFKLILKRTLQGIASGQVERVGQITEMEISDEYV